MNNVYVLNEIFTNGYASEILNILSILGILCGILVIISKNPIVSVLFLIGLFLSIASYLLIIGLSFIGLSYLLVYIGAVSILFLFILMLINVRISELLSNTNNSIPLAVLISIAYSYPVYENLPNNNISVEKGAGFIYDLFYNIVSFMMNLFGKSNNETYGNNLYYVSSNLWDGNISEITHISNIGNLMYTNYSMWLIITSIILLLAMVGAIVITIKQENV